MYPSVLGSGDHISNPPGIYIELIKQVAEDIGMDVIFKRYPTKRLHQYLQENSINALCCMSYKIKREHEGAYPKKDNKPDGSKRIATKSYNFFTKDPKVRWDGSVLKNVQNIGAMRGYSIVSDLKRKGYNVSELDDLESGVKMLLAGRIQAFADNSITLELEIANRYKYEGIKKLSPVIKSKEYYIVFSKQYEKSNREMTTKFWKRLSEIRDSFYRDRLPFYFDAYSELKGK